MNTKKERQWKTSSALPDLGAATVKQNALANSRQEPRLPLVLIAQ